MSRARKAKRAAKKPAPIIFSQHDAARMRAMESRLTRANAVLTCLECLARHEDEVDLSSLSIAARDLVDKVLEDLSAFNRGIRGLVATMAGDNDI